MGVNRVEVGDQTLLNLTADTVKPETLLEGVTAHNAAGELITGTANLKGAAQLSVQVAHPNNYLIYDDVGKPSVMVRIPKLYLDDLIEDAPHTIHPAFIVNGEEVNAIYISKYQNVVNNGRAYSLPMQDPAASLNFDQAWQYCKQKGPGWHLMTNAEWAAVALWCKKNGFMPHGNNNYGKDTAEGSLPQKALATTRDSSNRICRTATGSGPASWYHDNTAAGIADLNGNVWEWCGGMRLVNGEIQIIPNNDAADWNNPLTSASTLWRAIMPDGSLVAPGTAGTLKWGTAWSNTKFASIVTTPAATGAGITLLESLGLKPHADATSADYGDDAVWATLTDERLPSRGGSWDYAASAGVFALSLNNARSYVPQSIGFRAAYYE